MSPVKECRMDRAAVRAEDGDAEGMVGRHIVGPTFTMRSGRTQETSSCDNDFEVTSSNDICVAASPTVTVSSTETT